MSKTLYFKISNDGNDVSIDAHGFVGTECEDATLPYEETMGTITGKHDKPERMQQSQEETHHVQQD